MARDDALRFKLIENLAQRIARKPEAFDQFTLSRQLFARLPARLC